MTASNRAGVSGGVDAGGEEKRDKRSLSLLLVQKYLRFQYNSTNTDAYNALRQDWGIMYLVTRLKDLGLCRLIKFIQFSLHL